jgi:hypothetical protein
VCLAIAAAATATFLGLYRDHSRPGSAGSLDAPASATPTPIIPSTGTDATAAPPVDSQTPTLTPTQPPGATNSHSASAPAGAITSPADRADVQTCAYFAGTATMPARTTLILAKRNLSNGSPNKYVELVHQWSNPQTSWTWQGAQYFGNGNDSVGQQYLVELMAVDLAAARDAHDSGNLDGLATIGTVLANRRVNRVAGTATDDPCEGP